MLLVLQKPKVANTIVHTFKEEFQRYLQSCKGKKKKWATKEGFQLEFDSSWEDLQKAYYLFPGNEEIANEIKSKLKVIEERNDIY